MKKTMFIEVNTQFEFFHKWENAPEEVGFLRNLHRHDFLVTCQIEVYHNDRELEFFMVLHRLESFINDELKHMPATTSCEQFCEKIGEFLIETYGNRNLMIKVSEDGKSASIMNYEV